MNHTEEVKNKLRRIRLLVLDVDGVMTDGSIFFGANEEIKVFNVHDGAGIKYLMRSDIRVALLSGRSSNAVSERARELGIKDCLQGCKKKLPFYQSLIKRLEVEENAVACMGDDLPDIPLFNHCGLKIAPKNAAPEIITRADIITNNPGGRGAVREVAETILKAQDKWQHIVESYLVQ